MNRRSNILLNELQNKEVNGSFSGKIYSKSGVLNKTILGLGIIMMILLLTYSNQTIRNWFIIGYIPILIVSFIFWIGLTFMIRKNIKLAKTAFFAYSIIQGILMSVIIWATSEYIDPYIPIQAGILTILVFFTMSAFYKFFPNLVNRILPIIGVAIAAAGIFYILRFVLSFIPGLSINENSQFSFIMNIILIVVASFSFLLDFRAIEDAEKNNIPSEYEWLGALGLLSSLIWLYIEILRLLSRNRD